jgi:DsbC/DsbD-like thiol-disulfide interchange protein
VTLRFCLAPAMLAGLSFAATPLSATTAEEVLQGRILSGWQTDRGTVMMAVELTLAPGWKTYWRSPGDAGIPPSFDWAGSSNFAGAAVHWPRPEAFHTNGMLSVGYHDGVILPVEIRPDDQAADGVLKLTLDLGVCRDICLPAAIDLAAPFPGDGSGTGAIKAALADRPAAGTAAGLRAISCAVEPVADGIRVHAAIDLPDLGGEEVVVFESGRPDIWVAEAESWREDGALHAVTEMVAPARAPFALDRSDITLTILGDGRAVEIQGCPAGD